MTGFNINPINTIGNYNQIVGANLPTMNNSNSINDFEDILQKQTEILNQSFNSPQVIEGAVSFDNNLFDGVQKVENLSSAAKTANDFGQAFSNGLNRVNEQQVKSQNLTMAFAAGEDVSVHEVMIESQKANLSMSMAMQLRNKLLNAYTEIYSMRF